MRRFLTAFASLLAIVMLAQAPALAASSAGTHAWTSQQLELRAGPGNAYALSGAIPAAAAIKVLRCQKLWCLVDGAAGRGWTGKRHIEFGLPPGAQSATLHTAPASVCFYQGANFTGAEFCVRPGRVIADLALLGLDNSFASVRVEGPASVAVCRDRFFQSYCERINVSQPRLTRYLHRALSSIRVY